MTNRGRLEVELSQGARRELQRMPPGDAARLRGPILALGLDPRLPGCSKLSGTALWRLRVDAMRIPYLIDETRHVVVVLRVARRSESTCRGLSR